MCDDEKQSGQFGISWTLDKDYAKNYVFYKKNEVKGKVGWCAEMEIDKSEIFAVWGVVSKRKEIVINPKKCRKVKFVEVIKE
jgi:predicted nucleic acid-binding Zn finger protein